MNTEELELLLSICIREHKANTNLLIKYAQENERLIKSLRSIRINLHPTSPDTHNARVALNSVTDLI